MKFIIPCVLNGLLDDFVEWRVKSSHSYASCPLFWKGFEWTNFRWCNKSLLIWFDFFTFFSFLLLFFFLLFIKAFPLFLPLFFRKATPDNKGVHNTEEHEPLLNDQSFPSTSISINISDEGFNEDVKERKEKKEKKEKKRK